ncbi:Na+/H+ antiporter subunit E [Rickettsiales endosymbiont of Stachyamoeba lipophora]|uniref:Na+/H+ antiporter subunit E n=1 Tax=Rickettsiales endosymbiont of Stachyamoeba lipophora TaxID=2486578 RepID=UPI000F647DA1|nr:Na+/H+ antiporter subunit E [Rickettsiales endosymbiont of Stachyamoeba lipophora]AZL15786.1 hypothetical protein EF513_04405 [Rickettsiales endosymbiont of Stachyamoeba lipophora]
MFRWLSFYFLLWYCCSGSNDSFLLSTGILSSFLTFFLAKHLKLYQQFSAIKVNYTNTLFYIIYIFKEIANASLYIIKKIISFKPSLKPKFVKVTLAPESSEAQIVFYANSITLTPGTITIKSNADELIVHAIDDNMAEGLKDHEMFDNVKKFINIKALKHDS